MGTHKWAFKVNYNPYKGPGWNIAVGVMTKS